MKTIKKTKVVNVKVKHKKGEPVINGKQKWDFPLLKQEFLRSEFYEVTTFFRNTYGTYTKHIRLMTNGWSKDKKEYSQRMLEQAEDEYKEEQKNKWKLIRKNIDTAHMSGLQELAERLLSDKKTKLGVKDIETIIKLIKLEKGESTENISDTTKKSSLMELYDEISEK